MRIGVFGNTNNYPLLLTMALRRLGHNAVLAVNRKDALHRPESRVPEFRRGYPDWILDCSSIAEEDFVAGHSRIESVLNFIGSGSDALLLNDVGPSLHEFCPLPSLALLTGSDVSYYADSGMPVRRLLGTDPAWAASPGGMFYRRHWESFVARQRAGIANAVAVSAPLPGLVPAVDAILADIGVEPTRREFLYIADAARRPRPPQPADDVVRVVNGARLIWKKPLPAGFSTQDHKGTDILLRGFARCVAGGGQARLTLFRKGCHVAETEALARELMIDTHIDWQEETTAAAFAAIVGRADIVCDQLGESFPGLAGLDAMAAGLPVIANFRPDICGAIFPEPLPACQASTPDEVAGHLETLATAPGLRAELGEAGRRFAETHLSPRANAEKCLRSLGLSA